jgi:hypothetical protein
MKDLTHVILAELVTKFFLKKWALVPKMSEKLGLVSKHNPQNFGEVVHESTLMM